MNEGGTSATGPIRFLLATVLGAAVLLLLAWLVVNAYFPNGNGKERDNSRVPFKLRFYRRLFQILEQARQHGDRILVMGDFNTAHREIDLARPKQNTKTSGFLPIERAELDRWRNNR